MSLDDHPADEVLESMEEDIRLESDGDPRVECERFRDRLVKRMPMVRVVRMERGARGAGVDKQVYYRLVPVGPGESAEEAIDPGEETPGWTAYDLGPVHDVVGSEPADLDGERKGRRL